MSESAKQDFLLINPLSAQRRYEYSITSTTREIFTTEVTKYFVFKHPELADTITFDEEYQEDYTLAYFDSLDEELDLVIDTFYVRGEPTLVNFFSLQMIDIPKPFSRAKSLYRPDVNKPKIRFLNMITRHGKKAKISKAYSYALTSVTKDFYLLSSKNNNSVNWKYIYSALNQIHILYVTKQVSTSFFPYLTKYSDYHFKRYYLVGNESSVQDTIFDSLLEYVPIFSFYVKKVDKLKRRHSRGKSGKYSIAWKYVPKYRRLLTTIRWLAKDVRTQKAKTLNLRLLKSLETFMFDRDSHLIPRLRQFVHSFVFQNHKKNLLKTLKATSA